MTKSSMFDLLKYVLWVLGIATVVCVLSPEPKKDVFVPKVLNTGEIVYVKERIPWKEWQELQEKGIKPLKTEE